MSKLKILLLLLPLATGCATGSPTRFVASAQGPDFHLALGPSVPAGSSPIPGGPITRRSGGEVVALVFVNPDTKEEIPQKVEKVTLTGFSKSGQGKTLVRLATSRPQAAAGTFDPLTKFASISADSHAQNHDGLAMLGNGDSVSVEIPADVSANRLMFIFEAFTDDDASVGIQISVDAKTTPLALGSIRLVVADAPGNQEPAEPHHHAGGGGNSGGGGSGTGGGSSDSGHSSSQPPPGHSGSCVSHGSNGECDVWSGHDGTNSCVSHGSNGQCDMWSGSSGNTSCVSHGSNGQCEMWSGSGGNTSCVSHGSNGQCEMWSGSGGNVSCVSHGSNGSCEMWSDGRSCVSHDSNGNCAMWNK